MTPLNKATVHQQIQDRVCDVHTSKEFTTGFFISEKGLIATVLNIAHGINTPLSPQEITVKYKAKTYSVAYYTSQFINQNTGVSLFLLQISPPISNPCFSWMQNSSSELKIGAEVYCTPPSFNPSSTTQKIENVTIASLPSDKDEVKSFTFNCSCVLEQDLGMPVVEVRENKLQLIGIIFQTTHPLAQKESMELYYSKETKLQEVLHAQHISDQSTALKNAKESLCKFILKNARNTDAVELVTNYQTEEPPLDQLKMLRLSQRSLNTLPKEICLLSNLIYLDLMGNNFENFPQEILVLKKLTMITLGSNKLTSLPTQEILTLKELHTLEIFNNPIKKASWKLSKVIGIGNLPYGAEWDDDG